MRSQSIPLSREYVQANLNKLNPLRPLDRHLKWDYERRLDHVRVGASMLNGNAELRSVRVGEYAPGHHGKAQSCEACWQARYDVYMARSIGIHHWSDIPAEVK